MKTIKILGSGCARCKRTESVVYEALEKYNLVADVKKVEDIRQIMEYHVMATPAVVVDEQVKIMGRVPTVEEVRGLVAD